MNDERSPQPRFSWLAVALLLTLVAAGLVAYSTSFGGTFVFDDEKRIVNNPVITQLWPLADLLASSRPVVDLSLQVNYALGGLNVWGYHAFNLAVHLLAALALFGVVRRSLSNGKEGVERSSLAIAFAVALLWVVHPLTTGAVTYVIQRAESLMGLFYLLTLYAALRGMRSPRPFLWYGVAIVACALSLGSKTVAVTAPVVVLLYDRAFVSGSFVTAVRRRYVLHLGLFSTWSFLVLGGVVKGIFFPSPGQVDVVGFGFTGATPAEYALTQPGVLLHYLKLCFWPHPLILDYFWPIVSGSLSQVLLPALVIALLLAATLWATVTRPRLGFLGLWFFLILAPTSSFIPLQDAAFEHRMYLPLAAVVALVVVATRDVVGRLLPGQARGRLRAAAAAGLLAVVASLFIYMTHERNLVYASNMTLWRDIVDNRPSNPRGHYSLAIYLIQQDRPDDAIRALEKAIALEPRAAEARFALGVTHMNAGRTKMAIDAFQGTVAAMPAHARAHYQLGRLYHQEGNAELALVHVKKAVAGGLPEAVQTLAVLEADQPRQELEAARKAREAAPDDVPTLVRLARLLAARGDFGEAMVHLTEGLRLAPNSPQAHHEMAVTLAMQRRMPEAIEHFRIELQLAPDELEPRVRLGAALANEGDLAGAIAVFQAAAERFPDEVQPRELLEKARTELAAGSDGTGTQVP